MVVPEPNPRPRRSAALAAALVVLAAVHSAFAVVLPGEVDPVLRALEEHGLTVTALHNHMVDEMPRMYWIHWYATGDGPSLARGALAALSRMNSARRSLPESERIR
jgi:hypothetical protein